MTRKTSVETAGLVQHVRCPHPLSAVSGEPLKSALRIDTSSAIVGYVLTSERAAGVTTKTIARYRRGNGDTLLLRPHRLLRSRESETLPRATSPLRTDTLSAGG